MHKEFGVVVVVMALAVTAVANEQWVGFSTDGPGSEARIEIGKVGTRTVEFDLVIPGVGLERVSTAEGDFTRVTVPGLGANSTVGEPMLPVLRRFVEIPQGATATVTTTALDRSTVALAAEGMPATVFPAQLPIPKCDCDEARSWVFSFQPKAYRGVVERQPVLSGPSTLRDHRMMMVDVSPARYDVAAGTVEIATRMRVTVTIEGGDEEATAAIKQRLSSRHYDAFLRNAAVNLNFTEAGGWAYPDTAPVEFLIVTPPQFVADLAPFVEWKTSTGYNVSVVTTDVAGTTTTAIKSYITGLYNGPNPPVYILMIGDSPSPLATYTPSGGGTGGTDLPYVRMDADLYPDMMIARWPIDDSTELVNMRDKILHYERPTAGNSAWLNRALFLAGDDYWGRVTTHEEVTAQLMDQAPNSAETEIWYGDSNATPQPGTPFPPTTSDLIADLNTGRAWAVYSAHCSQSGMAGDPSFTSGDVPNLGNADTYPIGHGHCCLSNQWATNSDVFGEVAVTLANKGFVAYWGGSNSTYWDGDDWLEKGFFDALFDDDISGIGGDWDRLYSNIAACYAGLSEVTVSNVGNEAYYWPMYNLNGDPTLDPFTRAPIAMTVGAPPVVPPVADLFTVTVSDGAVGPVPLAMVGVTQDGVLLGAGLTDATGTAVFPIDAPSPGSDLLVRVTAHNHLPTDADTMVAAGSDGVVVLDGTVYRCDSTVTINVFDDDLSGAPPFNVTLSASPSGGSIQVPVSSVGAGIVQYQGTAVLGAGLVVQHGDVLTVTYNDADTGAGSPAAKTDTAVLDCAGPVVSNVQLTTGLGSLTLTFDTDEAGTTEVSYGTSPPPSTVIGSPGMGTSHSVVLNGTEPCTTYFFEIQSADALGNLTIDDNGGSYYAFTTGGEAGVVEDATDTPVAIPDNNSAGASSFISIDAAFPILDVDVLVNITHTYTGDLELLLISPTGTTVSLSDRHGGSGDNFTDTVFDDEAGAPISGGSAPFTGSYQPDGALSTLDGQLPTGVWTFKVVDRAGIDTGNIEGWQLRLTLDSPCDGLFSDGFESGGCALWTWVFGEL